MFCIVVACLSNLFVATPIIVNQNQIPIHTTSFMICFKNQTQKEVFIGLAKKYPLLSHYDFACYQLKLYRLPDAIIGDGIATTLV